jgi:hypothetical protein
MTTMPEDQEVILRHVYSCNCQGVSSLYKKTTEQTPNTATPADNKQNEVRHVI